MRSFGRLIKYPHRKVFDVSAQQVFAFLLEHEGLVRWSVADYMFTAVLNNDGLLLFLDIGDGSVLSTDGDTLLSIGSGNTITVGEVSPNDDGTVSVSYSLRTRTIQQLVDDLTTDGFTVTTGDDSSLYSLMAYVLVDGIGQPSYPIVAFTSLLWVALAALSSELDTAKTQILNAIAQMNINNATDEWLDLWGGLLASLRASNEADSVYKDRIKRDAFRKRLNKYAIELAILEETGKTVEIEEMFIYLFRLDNSRLSSSSRFGNGSTVGAFIIRPVSSISIDWTDVLAVIDKNKAAGIIILPPIVR